MYVFSAFSKVFFLWCCCPSTRACIFGSTFKVSGFDRARSMANIFQHQNPNHSQDPLPLESCHRKGPWTPEEDQLLITCISSLGVSRWDSIAKASGLNRNGKSCRLRWVNYLRPDLKRGKITYEEEQRIIELQKLWGNKWSRIAKCLPGRTDNEIKNYFKNHLRKGNKRSFCKDGINGSVIGGDPLNDQQHHHDHNHQTQEEHQSQYSSEESDDCSANLDSFVTRILCDFQGEGLMDEGTIAVDIIASSTNNFVDNTFFDYSDQLWKIN